MVPGLEGAGTVVKTGDGEEEKALQGKRVSFTKMAETESGHHKNGGTWSEFVLTNATQCWELDDDITWEQGASSFINPFSAIGLLDKIKDYGGKSIIQTAAASQLAGMMRRLCKENNITVVNVVRRAEQVEQLKAEGVEHVLDSSTETFDRDLYALSQQLECTVGLDPIAGNMPARILQVLGPGGALIQYGELSLEKISYINPVVFIYKAQTLEGFWLGGWLETKSADERKQIGEDAKKLLPET